MVLSSSPSPPLPPLSPLSMVSTPNQQTPPIALLPPKLPHSIVSAAHCLAPLEDLHLAHLVNEIKPPLPVWSYYDNTDDRNEAGPRLISNDRLRSDELADLTAPEAERLHAAYDIEDHLDCTPNKLIVYGPSTPITQILEELKHTLISTNNSPSSSSRSSIPSTPALKSRYNCENEIYVARLWFKPTDGPANTYTWQQGGAEFIRFEFDPHQTEASDRTIINWSPVEVALSQAVEVGHQLLALLHSRHFAQVLASINPSAEFRPIDPIIWLVDPVEYAHAQLRETTEWGWAEHHVELKSIGQPPTSCSSTISFPSSSAGGSRPGSYLPKDHNIIGRPLSRSQLSHEVQPQNSIDPHRLFQPLTTESDVSTSRSYSSRLNWPTVLADDLPAWLDDLLDRRLPTLLSLPGGCLSYELLQAAQPCVQLNPNPIKVNPTTHLEPRGSRPHSSHSSIDMSSKLAPLSCIGSPIQGAPLGLVSLANSAPSFDQVWLSSPGSGHPDLAIIRGQRHAQTNTLRYFPCKACTEHAFKLALSHKLEEEKRSTRLRKLLIHNNKQQQMNNNLIDKDKTFEVGEPFEINSSHSYSTTTSLNNSHFDCKMRHSTSNHNSNNDNHSGTLNLMTGMKMKGFGNPNEDYLAIGLGLKGKAVKEAMDREDDEFIIKHSKHKHDDHNDHGNDHQIQDCVVDGNRSNDPIDYIVNQSNHKSCDRTKHNWDEGESVDD